MTTRNSFFLLKRLGQISCFLGLFSLSIAAGNPVIQFEGAAQVRSSLLTHDIVARGLDGQTYFVSPEGQPGGKGTKDAPFGSIEAAAKLLNPGDTLLLRGGVYTGNHPDALAFIRSQGSEDRWIRIANYPGERPIIQFNSQRGFSLQGVRYLLLEGIEFYGESDKIEPAEAIAYGEAFDDTEEREVRFFGVGIRIEGLPEEGRSGFPHHVIVRNCRIYHTAGGGIAVARGDYILIEDNEIFETSHYSPWGESGISVWESANFDNRQDVYRTVIQGNRSYRNDNKVRFWITKTYSDGNGIILDALRIDQAILEDGGTEPYTGRILVKDNVCFENGGRGINVYESDAIDIVGNTLIHNSLRGNSQYEIELGRTRGTRIIDNVIMPKPGKKDQGGYEFEAIIYAENLVY